MVINADPTPSFPEYMVPVIVELPWASTERANKNQTITKIFFTNQKLDLDKAKNKFPLNKSFYLCVEISEMTYSEENYLKAIYHLSLFQKSGVNTNAISKMIDTKASSVTDMIKKLADKDLVEYQKYQGVLLTQSGLLAAKMIVRKHRLWEVFLVNKLGFSWDEVHDVAEEL